MPPIRRFKTVIKQYDTTNQVPEALYRLSESYQPWVWLARPNAFTLSPNITIRTRSGHRV